MFGRAPLQLFRHLFQVRNSVVQQIPLGFGAVQQVIGPLSQIVHISRQLVHRGISSACGREAGRDVVASGTGHEHHGRRAGQTTGTWCRQAALQTGLGVVRLILPRRTRQVLALTRHSRQVQQVARVGWGRLARPRMESVSPMRSRVSLNWSPNIMPSWSTQAFP